MTAGIETHGLTELIARMQAYPDVLKRKVGVAMNAVLLKLWENVPAYPPAPDNSSYTRTGELGRSLGSGEGGGVGADHPAIYEVREMGAAGYEAHFGTNLNYAGYVISDEEQAWMHQGRWWIMKTVLARATDGINNVFKMLSAALAKFLEGRGE